MPEGLQLTVQEPAVALQLHAHRSAVPFVHWRHSDAASSPHPPDAVQSG
jgi:hypothetical protein